MFERFTERARKVVVLAQEEARHFNHNYIGTEHLLLGVLRLGEGAAAQALASLDVTLREAREQVESIVGHGEEETDPQPPFTPRAKKVLELALRESMQLGHNFIVFLLLQTDNQAICTLPCSFLTVVQSPARHGPSLSSYLFIEPPDFIAHTFPEVDALGGCPMAFHVVPPGYRDKCTGEYDARDVPV
jgi:hypothetical protein